MSKRDSIYDQASEYLENGSLPTDDPEFITRFFGAKLVGAMDSNLENAFKTLDGEDNVNHDLKTQLSTLDHDQKAAVKELLEENAKGFFYSMMLKLRDFNYPVEVNFLDPDSNKKLCGLEDEQEFHFHYHDWIEEFSDYVEES
ncbi:hypothetical protein [Reichenbachiella versicolor]|uniref:hypothetical protein n=1 Tax=Reichenbachiella versicolor TaxID=1821036 RepID=UPI000D6E0241|nr:hypothetical protein [Reichenbachiella versicolor]